MNQETSLRVFQVFGLVLVFTLVALFLTGDFISGAIGGAALFLFYRVGVVRLWLCRHHRHGIACVRDNDIDSALRSFSMSEAYWRSRQRLDTHRSLLLGVASPWSFWELAIYNQAYCLYGRKQYAEAIAALDEVLSLNPQMRPARELRGALRSQTPAPSWNEMDFE